VNTYAAASERVLDALGDPTRRAVLELLREGPRPVGEIARALPVSRPAVSQHLRILKDAGLVQDHREGTRRLYRVDPAGLSALRAYLERYWDSALAAFARAAERAADAGTTEEPRPR
jgi:DNA-binding transcriptional ArsR family regulator